ncbi:uncharacterized protein RMCT_3245 [Mycolicibacterium thermoresistibile]|uniref:Uncharacterized protein n=1 Tax=Mycolicibacterium thermoresistibile TaxID=1797 RepID=A0A100XGM3_MYCTH|nr:uncharacterized protein RMCT_3245 [Mycolicibacterium thermoresistibile]
MGNSRIAPNLTLQKAATAATGAILTALHATIGLPWWMWAAYATLVAAQLGNRIIRGWAR